MADPCITDTDSIDLAVDATTGHLTAALRLDPDGSLGVTASGTKLRRGANSGLGVDAEGSKVLMQGNNFAVNSTGIQISNNYAAAGWIPGAVGDFVTHNQAIGAGATVVVGSAVALGVFNPASITQNYVVHCTWGVGMQTTFSEFGTSLITDSVEVVLQYSVDGSNWGELARGGLMTFRQASQFELQCTFDYAVGPGASFTFQTRLVAVGGTGGIHSPGTIQRTFHRGIIWMW